MSNMSKLAEPLLSTLMYYRHGIINLNDLIGLSNNAMNIMTLFHYSANVRYDLDPLEPGRILPGPQGPKIIPYRCLYLQPRWFE